MVEMNQYAPGTFCWIELGTSDAAGAKKFYSELFGWAPEDVPAGDMGTYTMVRRSGKNVGGLYQFSDEQKAHGVPPHWLSYVSVENADDAAEKAESLGGTLLMEAMDVMDIGRMALVQDPAGATFALWQAKKHIGAQLVNEEGSLCWNELMTGDVSAAGDFYSKLLGWATQEMDMSSGKYTMFMNGEKPAGGMMAIAPEMGPIPPNWLVYFAVADCDDTVQKTTVLGGKTLVPPTDIPDVGRFACLQDPQGAVFNVIQLSSAPSS
jgi:predicted enzyme related to lactoylglutathione lyase